MGLGDWLRGEWGSGKIERDITYWRQREIIVVRGMTHRPKAGWGVVSNPDMNLRRGGSGWFKFFTRETTGAIARREGTQWQPTTIEKAQSTQDGQSPWFWYRRAHGGPNSPPMYEVHESRNDPRVMDAAYGKTRWGSQPPEPQGSWGTGEPIVESWPGMGDPRGDPPPGYTSW